MNMYHRSNEPNETISNRDEIGKSKEKKADVIFQSHRPFYLRFGYGGGLTRSSNRA